MRIFAGLVAVLILGIGMDYICTFLGPLDYLGINAPKVFYFFPALLACIAYLLATWRFRKVDEGHGEPPKTRTAAYVIRLGVFVVLCAVGYYAPFVYRDRMIEFVPILGNEIQFEQGLRLESALGFKVGIQTRYSGQRIYFQRETGRAERVMEALEKQKLTGGTTNVSK
jgi:hypothetical protein